MEEIDNNIWYFFTIKQGISGEIRTPSDYRCSFYFQDLQMI